MRVAIIGTHASGKTTLCNKLYKCMWFDYYHFAKEPMREVARLGFQVNEKADDASQLAMVSLHLHNLLFKNAVMDRSLLDAYIYAKYLNQTSGIVSDETTEFIHSLMLKNIHRYDYLFLCEPEFELQNDGFRSTDLKFRNDIAEMFVEEIAKIPSLDVVVVRGTTQERSDKVLKTLFS